MTASSHPAYRKRLRTIKNGIVGTKSDFDIEWATNTLAWAVQTNKKNAVSRSELFSDPFVLIEALIDLVGADAETIYAAIIYPALRSETGAHLNYSYFDEISPIFKGEDGFVDEQYMTVRNLAVNTLQIRALDLPPPASLTSVDSVFDQPKGKEAINLAAYFILSKHIAEDNRAWNIRATQWYLRLVNMRENPEGYTHEERMLAYYYTDKFYSPFCEYLALQKLKEDKTYSPLKENKGLYRLKTAMDEELVRQINPRAHKEIQGQMQEFVRSFEVDARERPNELKGAKLNDLVTYHIEQEFSSVLYGLGIPKDFVRIEARWKRPRSIFQKILAGRKDIHDYFGIRFTIDVRGIEAASYPNTVLSEKKLIEISTALTGRLHAAIAKIYDEVPGRHRNFYVHPAENGYRSVQNTFKILGQDVEVQIVDLDSHINNSIGTASHFIYKIFVRKSADGQRENKAPTDLLRAFNEAKNWVVVRTAKDFFVLKAGATIATLARRIHSKLLAEAVSAIVTDRDPTHILNKVRVFDLETPIRSGQIIHIETSKDKLAA